MEQEATTRRRLVPRQLRYSELRRGDAVTLSGSEGEVEGVFVNFGHPDLPPGEWEARPWWVVWDSPPDSAGFIFPYEAKFDLEAYRRWVPGVQGLPALYANPGDTITVEAVECEEIGGPFDHVHDISRKLVRLVLIRSDGEEVRPQNPLAFYGVTQLRDAPPIEAYDRLVERVLADHDNPRSIEQLSGMHFAIKSAPASVPELRERALRCVGEAERSLTALWDTLDADQQKLLQRAVAGAALAGFSQGKAELRKAEKQARGSAKGRAHGPKSQLDQEAIDFAKAAWAKEPARRKKNIAQELAIIRCGEADENLVRAIMRTLQPYDPHKKG